MNIPEELLPMVEWWEKDGKKTLVIAAVVGLAALAWWTFKSRRDRMADAAGEAVSIAVNSAIQVQIDPKSPAAEQSIEDLKTAIATAGESKSATLMKLMLASDLFARKNPGDIEGALAIYDELVKSGETPVVYAEIPELGRAQCLEALGKYADAKSAFEGFLGARANSPFATTAKLGIARVMAQSGDKAGALAYLGTLEKNDADKEAIEFTTGLVKRWMPESSRTPAPEPPAEVKTAEKPEEATPAAPAAPEEPKPTEEKKQ